MSLESVSNLLQSVYIWLVMQVLRRYRLRGIVAAGRKPTYSICFLMSEYAPHELDPQWEAYVKDKMREYGMSDGDKVAAWLEEVLFQNTYFTQSILMPFRVREQEPSSRKRLTF